MKKTLALFSLLAVMGLGGFGAIKYVNKKQQEAEIAGYARFVERNHRMAQTEVDTLLIQNKALQTFLDSTGLWREWLETSKSDCEKNKNSSN